MRNQDNFVNASQYIVEQLGIFNYASEDEMKILNQKIKVLDGPLRPSENLTDEDINNPKDHYTKLQSELVFADVYARTKEGTLGANEPNFEKLKATRIANMEKFVASGRLPHEMAYQMRPTTLSDDQFEAIYQVYLAKKPQGISNAKELLSKIPTFPLDLEIRNSEMGIANTPTAAEMENQALAQAAKLRREKDDISVDNLNNIWAEAWDIMLSLRELAESRMEPDPEEHTGTPSEDNPKITRKDKKFFIANVPCIRAWVALIKNDPSHVGLNNNPENPDVGGYRYGCWDPDTRDITAEGNYVMLTQKIIASGGTVPDVPDGDYADWFPVFPAGTILPSYAEMVAQTSGQPRPQPPYPQYPNMYGMHDYLAHFFFIFCYYYVDEIDKGEVANSGGGGENGGEPTPVIEEKAYCQQLATFCDLPDGGKEPNDYTYQRLSELGNRWMNINRERENMVQMVGTRSQIEMLVDMANIPNIGPDLVNHKDDLIIQKESYTNILKETREEFN